MKFKLNFRQKEENIVENIAEKTVEKIQIESNLQIFENYYENLNIYSQIYKIKDLHKYEYKIIFMDSKYLGIINENFKTKLENYEKDKFQKF